MGLFAERRWIGSERRPRRISSKFRGVDRSGERSRSRCPLGLLFPRGTIAREAKGFFYRDEVVAPRISLLARRRRYNHISCFVPFVHPLLLLLLLLPFVRLSRLCLRFGVWTRVSRDDRSSRSLITLSRFIEIRRSVVADPRGFSLGNRRFRRETSALGSIAFRRRREYSGKDIKATARRRGRGTLG